MMRLVVVGLLWPVALHATPDWVGMWSQDLGWCDNDPETAVDYNQLPLTITTDGMSGNPETYCAITAIDPLPDVATTRVELDCFQGADAYPQHRLLLQGDPDVLHIWFGGDASVTFRRCPGGDI